MKTRSRDERERFFETERVPADEKKRPRSRDARIIALISARFAF